MYFSHHALAATVRVYPYTPPAPGRGGAGRRQDQESDLDAGGCYSTGSRREAGDAQNMAPASSTTRAPSEVGHEQTQATRRVEHHGIERGTHHALNVAVRSFCCLRLVEHVDQAAALRQRRARRVGSLRRLTPSKSPCWGYATGRARGGLLFVSTYYIQYSVFSKADIRNIRPLFLLLRECDIFYRHR